MNPWDAATWLAAAALAAAAVGIFGFFLRDARSIFDREMRDPDAESNGSSASESTAGGARPDRDS